MAAGTSGEQWAGSYSRAYNDNISVMMFEGARDREIDALKWMDVRTAGDKPFEKEALWKAFGPAPVHYGNQDIEFKAPTELGDVSGNYREFWLGFAVDYTFTTKRGTREAMPEIARMLGRSINSAARTVGAEAFNQAFSTTYPTAADAFALISASHASPNLVTGNPPLNRVSLEDALTLQSNATDSAGNILDLPPGTLIVGSKTLEYRGNELLFTQRGKPETALNDKNVFADLAGMQVVREAAATNTLRWLIAPAKGFHTAKLFLSPVIRFGPGFDEKKGTYFASLRFEATWIVRDYGGFVGSNPT